MKSLIKVRKIQYSLIFIFIIIFFSNTKVIGQTTDKNSIKIKGNSTSYAGYIITEIVKKNNIQIFDFTDKINEARQVEASMKDICNPNHREFAIKIEENLKNPSGFSTVVTLNENRNLSENSINIQIIIENSSIKKELKYSLDFGNTAEDLIKCNNLFLSQVEEIANNIVQFNN